MARRALLLLAAACIGGGGDEDLEPEPECVGNAALTGARNATVVAETCTGGAGSGYGRPEIVEFASGGSFFGSGDLGVDVRVVNWAPSSVEETLQDVPALVEVYDTRTQTTWRSLNDTSQTDAGCVFSGETELWSLDPAFTPSPYLSGTVTCSRPLDEYLGETQIVVAGDIVFSGLGPVPDPP